MDILKYCAELDDIMSESPNKKRLLKESSVKKPTKNSQKNRRINENYGNDGYMYLTKHGLGPGTLPKDVHLLKAKDLPHYMTAIWLDRFLTTDELKKFDIYPETEIERVMDFYDISEKDLLGESCNTKRKNRKSLKEPLREKIGKPFTVKDVMGAYYKAQSELIRQYPNLFGSGSISHGSGKDSVFILCCMDRMGDTRDRYKDISIIVAKNYSSEDTRKDWFFKTDEEFENFNLQEISDYANSLNTLVNESLKKKPLKEASGDRSIQALGRRILRAAARETGIENLQRNIKSTTHPDYPNCILFFDKTTDLGQLLDELYLTLKDHRIDLTVVKDLNSSKVKGAPNYKSGGRTGLAVDVNSLSDILPKWEKEAWKIYIDNLNKNEPLKEDNNTHIDKVIVELDDDDEYCAYEVDGHILEDKYGFYQGIIILDDDKSQESIKKLGIKPGDKFIIGIRESTPKEEKYYGSNVMVDVISKLKEDSNKYIDKIIVELDDEDGDYAYEVRGNKLHNKYGFYQGVIILEDDESQERLKKLGIKPGDEFVVGIRKPTPEEQEMYDDAMDDTFYMADILYRYNESLRRENKRYLKEAKDRWVQTPYGFKELNYKGITITDYKDCEIMLMPYRYTVDYYGDEAGFDSLNDAKKDIDEFLNEYENN